LKKPNKTRDAVTLRSKGNTPTRRKAAKLADEPEMKELSRMIEAGELPPERVRAYLKNRSKR